MKNRAIHCATPKPAVSFFDLEVLLNLVLQVINIIDRIMDVFFGAK